MAIPNILTRQFNRDGFLLLKNIFTNLQTKAITETANSLYMLPKVKNSYMKYYENINNERKLSRIENFINNDNCFELKLIVDNTVTPIIEEILTKRMVLFKDKINWKHPGGGCFKPHQDFEAWSDFPPNTFVTCAVCIDNSTIENGCLEMAPSYHRNGLLENNNGVINSMLVKQMYWNPILASNKDLIIFDSYTPHRSGINLTEKYRRVFYFTYNPLEEGNYYNKYFLKKRKEFPPDFDRINDIEINVNSKYNLANPMN